MAQDIFAPKSSFNIGYERPVAQPVEDKRGETQAKFQQMANEVQAAQVRAQGQIDRAKLGMANTLLSGLGSAVAGYGQAQAKTKMSGLANDWLDGIQTAQELRDQGKFNEAALAERKVTKQAVASGLDLDKYKTEFEAITGRPMEYVGQTREQQSFEMLKNDQNFQMAYFAAKGTLGPEAPEDKIMAEALTSIQKQAIAKNTLALVAAGNQLDWDTELKSAYKESLDTFDKGIVAGLVSRTQQGQPITPGEIDTVLMQHNLLSQDLIKPAYVTDEQWGEIKDRLTLQKEFLTTLKSSRDPDAMLTDMVSQMMQSAETPLDAMAVAAASDPANLSATLGINIPEVMNKVSKSAFTDNNWKKRGQIISDLQQVDVTTPVSANSTFSLETAPSFLQPYINSDKSTMKKNVDAGVAMIGKLKPMEMQNEGTRKQLYNGIMSITAGMLSDKEFYSSTALSSIFNNPNLKQSIDMVAAVDRESADEMRIAIRSAATMQKTALEANLQSIETNSLVGAVWDEQDKTYYITGDQGKAAQAFGYKGEMTDKGFKLAPTNVTFPEGYKDAVDRRKSLAILNRTISDLAIEGVEQDTTAPTETTTTMQQSDIRSIRNNNPGNIDRTSTQWEGMAEEQTDSRFVTFESPEMGVRAMARTLNTYNTRYGLDNIAGMVSRWAPPTENDTQAYIRFVSEKTGIPSDKTITLQDNPEEMRKVISAMIEMEGGQEASRYFNSQIVERGVNLALSSLGNRQEEPMQESEQITVSNIEGNVMARPSDESLASAWDILYSGTHDPETGQLIQGE
jgi:hypothetical protein